MASTLTPTHPAAKGARREVVCGRTIASLDPPVEVSTKREVTMKRYTVWQQRLEWRQRRQRNVLVLALALAVALTVATIASADSRTINFESYMLGTIDGQDGWAGSAGGPINPAIDQAVVSNTYGYTSFGGTSWRMSNAYTDGAFADWPFSPSLTDEAGESLALNGNGVLTFSGGVRQSHFEVQWDFASTRRLLSNQGFRSRPPPTAAAGPA
jgi:hypothetical protein